MVNPDDYIGKTIGCFHIEKIVSRPMGNKTYKFVEGTCLVCGETFSIRTGQISRGFIYERCPECPDFQQWHAEYVRESRRKFSAKWQKNMTPEQRERKSMLSQQSYFRRMANSTEEQREARRTYNREFYRSHRLADEPPPAIYAKMDRICRQCGKTFTGARNSLFCSDCAKERQLESTRRSKAKRAKDKPSASAVRAKIDRICCECGKTFTGAPNARFCPDCAKKRQLESKRRSKAKRANAKPSAPAVRAKMDRVCRQCGKTFIGARNSLFCSDCAKERRLESIRKSKAKRAKLGLPPIPKE